MDSITQSQDLSLYFGLKEGEKADLEIISRAAIDWVNTLRLAANSIDPNIEIKVQLVNAQESSLKLNTLLSWGEEKIKNINENLRYPHLTKNALALSIFLVSTGIPSYHYYFGEHDNLDLSDEDRERFDKITELMSNSDELIKSNRNFFSIIDNDQAVNSVGISTEHSTPPIFIVPKNQFAERSGLWSEGEVKDIRVQTRTSDVVLETANLTESKRKWKFRDDVTDIVFSAEMLDQDFIEHLKKGDLNENLRFDIRMEIDIKFKEHLTNGDWVSDKNSIQVTKVRLK